MITLILYAANMVFDLRFQVSNKIHTLPHVCDFIGQITDLISICLFLHLSNFCQEISHAAEFQSISNASWMHLHFAFLRPNSYLICLRFMKWWSVNGVKRNQYTECIWPSPDHFMMNTAVFMFLGLSVALMICYTIFYKTLITFGTVYKIFFVWTVRFSAFRGTLNDAFTPIRADLWCVPSHDMRTEAWWLREASLESLYALIAKEVNGWSLYSSDK